MDEAVAVIVPGVIFLLVVIYPRFAAWTWRNYVGREYCQSPKFLRTVRLWAGAFLVVWLGVIPIVRLLLR